MAIGCPATDTTDDQIHELITAPLYDIYREYKAESSKRGAIVPIHTSGEN
jgi:hypothetical protein